MGSIFGRAMAEAEEAPPVAEDAPVEAAVEAEAPAEDAAVEAAPASDTPDQTETPADDDAETPDEGPKEGAEEEDDAGRSGDEAPGETDGEPAGEPEADAEHTEGETRDAGDVDEPLEGAEGADTAVAPDDDESEWDTLTRLGLFKASSHASIDDLVDELVDQSMEMSGSDLDESMEDLDELYAQAPVVTREDPALKEAETLATLERLRQDLLAKNESLEKAIAAHLSKTKGNAYSTSPPAASTEQTTEDTIAPAEAAQRKIRYRNASRDGAPSQTSSNSPKTSFRRRRMRSTRSSPYVRANSLRPSPRLWRTKRKWPRRRSTRARRAKACPKM